MTRAASPDGHHHFQNLSSRPTLANTSTKQAASPAWPFSWHTQYIVGIITTVDSKTLIRLLTSDGWTLRAAKGSHHIFIHPVKKGHISVPHPKKDLGTGLVHKLLKHAGIADKGGTA